MLQEIKDILSGHEFMDVYSGYQIIADLWSSSLTRDLKLINGEGFYEAARMTEVVEVKGKKQEEKRGKLIPNEIVAEILFADRLEEIKKLEEGVQEKEAEKAEWLEKACTEDSEEAEILGDSLKEDKSDFDGKLIANNAKEAQAGSDEKKMLSAVKEIFDCIKKLNKEIKDKEIKDKEAQLKKDVQERYEKLTEPEIEKLYWRKWFHNIGESMVALVQEPLVEELKVLEMLEERYAQTVEEIDGEIGAAMKELEAMQAELVVG